MDSLNYPVPEEQDTDFAEFGDIKLEEARDLPTERILKILAGEEPLGFFTVDDLEETLLRRGVQQAQDEQFMSPNLITVSVILIFIIFAFFGWTLYKSLRDKEKKREEKKKLKQKKKK